MKSLFTVSAKVLLKMLNSLFDESFRLEDTEITVGNNEFIDDTLQILRGDVFFLIFEKGLSHHYHIEFQTKNDTSMIIRMFEYGFKKAKEIANYEKNANRIILEIPKQLVIFIEKNESIPDKIEMTILFPDGQQVEYEVKVMKYWKYDDKKLIEKKIYPLLPLQIFKLREKFEKVKNKEDKEETRKILSEAKAITMEIAQEAIKLFDEAELEGKDLELILNSAASLFGYINEKYAEMEEETEEVENMIKTLYDPKKAEAAKVEGIFLGMKEGMEKGIKEGIEKGMEKGREKGREEGMEKGIEKGMEKGMKEGVKETARKMLLDRVAISNITKYTGLAEKEIAELRKEIAN